MDSIEKLNSLLRGAYDFDPADEGTARLVQLLQAVGPMVVTQLPQTAGEFDEMLAGVANFAIGLRSDDAEPVSIAALTGGDL